jgi:hypothetical protein
LVVEAISPQREGGAVPSRPAPPAGIDRTRVEDMEARLKADVLREAANYDGCVLVAHEAAEAGVIGVLIFHEAVGKHDSWAVATNERREGDRVRRGDFKVGIAGELDEFVRCAQQRRGLGRLGGAFCGGAVGARFAS